MGSTCYLSRAGRNRAIHALNGNTPKSGAVGSKPTAKANAKVTARPAAKAVSQPTPLETVVVDPARCLGHIWTAGASRQCARRPGAGSQLCTSHAKEHGLTHGRLDWPMDAATRDKYAAAGLRGFGAKGFDWYSRVKLWDEARLLSKTPAAPLTFSVT